MEKNNLKQYIVPVAIGGTVIYIGYSLLQKFNIIDDAKDEQNLTLLNKGGPFDPTYFQSIPGARILTETSAINLINLLYVNDYLAWLHYDAQRAYNVFSILKTKTQVSYLAYMFSKIESESLIFYLRSYLSDSELNNVYKIVSKLPNK